MTDFRDSTEVRRPARCHNAMGEGDFSMQVRSGQRHACEGFILFLERIYSSSGLDGRPTFDVIEQLNANISLLAPYNSRSPALASVRDEKIEFTWKDPFPLTKNEPSAILGQVPHDAVDGTIPLLIDRLATQVGFAALLSAAFLHSYAPEHIHTYGACGSKTRATAIAHRS